MIPLSRYVICSALILSVIFPTVAASTTTVAPISIIVTKDRVNLSLNLKLSENLTSLPPFAASLDSSNSTVITTPMQAAMRKLVPGAQIDSLTMRAATSFANSATGTWQFVENYTIVVEGVNQNLGELVRSNLAFLAMNVSDSISLGSVQINGLGNAYLLVPFKNLPLTTTSTFYFDGAPYFNSNVSGNNTEAFHLLDFSWVAPVSQWNNHPDPLSGSSVWSLTPRITPFNLTVGLRNIENTLFPIYQVLYVPTLQVTAPARSWAQGTVVMFNLPSPTTVVMTVILIATVATLIVAVVFDRRLTARVGKKKRSSRD